MFALKVKQKIVNWLKSDIFSSVYVGSGLYLAQLGSAWLVMANLGQVLKKQVSGFDFKKPGYPGRVLGFQNCTNLANLDWKIGTFCQITKLVLFISPKYGNFKLFSEFLNILPQSEIFLIHQFDKPHAQYI